MKEIPLTKGKVAIVDDEDYPLLAAFRWHADSDRRGKCYAAHADYSGPRKRKVWMHRMIARPAAGLTVDHINGDSLDNRRANLRACTKAENCRNRRKMVSRSTTSRFKGVSFSDPWIAEIVCEGRTYGLGRFKTEEEAALAYDRAAHRLHGVYARLNFEPAEAA